MSDAERQRRHRSGQTTPEFVNLARRAQEARVFSQQTVKDLRAMLTGRGAMFDGEQFEISAIMFMGDVIYATTPGHKICAPLTEIILED
jgi:hypothetical protein